MLMNKYLNCLGYMFCFFPFFELQPFYAKAFARTILYFSQYIKLQTIQGPYVFSNKNQILWYFDISNTVRYIPNISCCRHTIFPHKMYLKETMLSCREYTRTLRNLFKPTRTQHPRRKDSTSQQYTRKNLVFLAQPRYNDPITTLQWTCDDPIMTQ